MPADEVRRRDTIRWRGAKGSSITALHAQLERIFPADHIRRTEMLGDVGYCEDRVHFIANHAAQVIRALQAEHARYATEHAHVRADVQALWDALGNVLALLAEIAARQSPHDLRGDLSRAMDTMIMTAPEAHAATQESA